MVDRDAPPSLDAWSRNAVVSNRLGAGHRNDTWLVHIGAERAVARVSRRSVASLQWEIEVLVRLASLGFVVPRVISTLDGRRAVDSVMVMSWVEGSPPATAGEWRSVADALRDLHEATSGWPQRPDFASTQTLLTSDRGGDTRLDDLPADIVAQCRAAWAALDGEPESVIHADARSNVLIDRIAVGFIDWDESRVDASVLDFDLPLDEVSHIEPERLRRARIAGAWWEVACSWFVEPDYARRRLAEI